MNFTTFLWQANLALLLLYAVYWAFLRRETFFRWNRLYLLGATLFALAFPFVPIPTLFQDGVPEDQVLLFFGGSEVEIPVNQVIATETAPLFIWENGLLLVYLIGVIFLSFRLFISLLQIFKLVFPFLCVFTQKTAFNTQKTIFKKQEGYFIVQTKAGTPIFSFLNILFWNEPAAVSEEGKAKILAHELVHIRQWHSVDVLFMEILTILCWCNPIIWAYRKSLQAVHEYLADALVLEKETSKTDYANLLVSQFLHTNTLYITNHFFNKSLLKNRIMMMYKLESKKIAKLKYGFFAPVIAFCLLIAACSEKITSELGKENLTIHIQESKRNKIITLDLNKFTKEQKGPEEEDYYLTETLKKTVKTTDIENLKLEVLQHPFPTTRPLEILLARGKRVVTATQRVENPNQINWKIFAENAQAGDRFIIQLFPQGVIFQYPRKRMENDIKRLWKQAKTAGYSDKEIKEEEQKMMEDYDKGLYGSVIFVVNVS